MKAYNASAVQLKKTNAEYLAIWDDMSLKEFLPVEEMIENEVGLYAAFRLEIGYAKNEKKRLELMASFKEWLNTQLRSVDKYLGIIEPDS